MNRSVWRGWGALEANPGFGLAAERRSGEKFTPFTFPSKTSTWQSFTAQRRARFSGAVATRYLDDGRGWLVSA